MKRLLSAMEHDGSQAGSPEAFESDSEWPQIPQYDVLDFLGQGGMGVVFKARHHLTQRIVALKLLKDPVYDRLRQTARFEAEVTALGKFDHPHIVRLYEVGEYRGSPYFSMEYVNGCNLAHLFGSNPCRPSQAATLVESLAWTVEALHERDVLHRDLKPGNILITLDGLLKISDFGLARHLDQDSHLTSTGAALGTPSYMAPEQAQGLRNLLGPTTDVYGLGGVLYRLLTGIPPFRGKTSAETLLHVLTQDPVPPRRIRSEIPADLEAICLRCLEKHPGRRYQSARELAEELYLWSTGKAIGTGLSRRASLKLAFATFLGYLVPPTVLMSSAASGENDIGRAAIPSLSLVGPKSAQKPKRWIYGNPDSQWDIEEPSRALKVTSKSTGVLTLLDTIPWSSYRYSVKFTNNSLKNLEKVGLYAGHVGHKRDHYLCRLLLYPTFRGGPYWALELFHFGRIGKRTSHRSIKLARGNLEPLSFDSGETILALEVSRFTLRATVTSRQVVVEEPRIQEGISKAFSPTLPNALEVFQFQSGAGLVVSRGSGVCTEAVVRALPL